MPTETQVLEYAANPAALRVDREQHVIAGVKIIGEESKNGYRYAPAALTAAISIYEGAKVNLGHAKGGITQPRDYRERLGVLKNIQHRPSEGLFGDLHYNPKHPIAEQLAYDAEHNPGAAGLSHAAFVKFAQIGAQKTAEQIVRLVSVDLVGDPATTNGLFEEVQTTQTPAIETSEQLAAAYPALIATLQLAATRQIAENAKALLAAGLPAAAIDEPFIDQVLAAAEQRDAILEARQQLIQKLAKPTPLTPIAAPRAAGSGLRDVKEFITAIR